MSIRVRYAGTDLCPEGVVETLAGDHYTVDEDDRVEILDEDDGVVGHIHSDRWQSVGLSEAEAAP